MFCQLCPQRIVVLEVHAACVSLLVADDVDVSSVDVLQGSPSWVDPYAHRSVDASNLNSITRSDFINEVFIRAQMDRLRRLSFGDRLWGLLNLDVLLVREQAQVMVDSEGVHTVAPFASVRLCNLALLDEASLFTLTLNTAESSLFHLWYDV